MRISSLQHRQHSRGKHRDLILFNDDNQSTLSYLKTTTPPLLAEIWARYRWPQNLKVELRHGRASRQENSIAAQTTTPRSLHGGTVRTTTCDQSPDDPLPHKMIESVKEHQALLFKRTSFRLDDTPSRKTMTMTDGAEFCAIFDTKSKSLPIVTLFGHSTHSLSIPATSLRTADQSPGCSAVKQIGKCFGRNDVASLAIKLFSTSNVQILNFDHGSGTPIQTIVARLDAKLWANSFRVFGRPTDALNDLKFLMDSNHHRNFNLCRSGTPATVLEHWWNKDCCMNELRCILDKISSFLDFDIETRILCKSWISITIPGCCPDFPWLAIWPSYDVFHSTF